MYGVLLIGDEILGAQVREDNLYYILRSLDSIGYRAGEVRIVADRADEIAHAVAALAEKYEFVITAGGIGPTHDDVTVESVAHAFRTRLEENEEMRTFLEGRYGTPLTPMVAEMAQMPVGTTVSGCADGRWPVIHFRNVYILPGLPRALRDKLNRIVDTLPTLDPPWRGEIFLNADESEFADDLSRLTTEMTGASANIAVGSYPVYGNYPYHSRISISGTDGEEVTAAWRELLDYFDGRAMVTDSTAPDQLPRTAANEAHLDG